MSSFNKYLILIAIGCIFASAVFAQQELPLYEGAIPNSRNTPDEEVKDKYKGEEILTKVSRPMLRVFLPPKDKATGAAVIVCPGGAYFFLAIGHEGTAIAKALAEHGIAAFVLKYRLPDDSTMVDKRLGPFQDAQRAIQIVRQHAKGWNIRTDRIGIMGFSAGGHLAAMTGTDFKTALIENKSNTSLRPDFMILAYPVITFKVGGPDAQTRHCLLGADTTEANIHRFSAEEQVTAETPATFLVHAGDDDDVSVDQSLAFYSALKKHDVSATMLIYNRGGHGFGVHNQTSSIDWLSLACSWINDADFSTGKKTGT
jgi:acetyl esterase/lipase